VTVPSYSSPGYPAPLPRTRPSIVTVASYLLFLVAVLEVINAILVFATLSTITDAVKSAYADTSLDPDSASSVVGVVYGVGAAINLVLAAGFAVLGIFNGRGKNPSRIVTWVVGGIALCCVGAGLGGNALTGSLEDRSTAGAPSQAEIQAKLHDALPSWYEPITMTVTVIILLAILATIILLALPASNAYFRKQPAAPGWDPAMQYPGYPQTPYGQAPQGQAPPGQAPPGQAPYGQPPYGQPPYGQQGQPGQPAPGLPSYPGQPEPPPSGLPSYPGQQGYGTPPPPSDPYGPPPSSPDEQPPKPPTDPA
jgi:hypothetical protein